MVPFHHFSFWFINKKPESKSLVLINFYHCLGNKIKVIKLISFERRELEIIYFLLAYISIRR